MKIIINIIAAIVAIVSFSTVCAKEWPGQKDGFSAPAAMYTVDKSCGDFVRAEKEYKENKSKDYLIYFYWISGYITALNSELSEGGNVLGSKNAKLSDFMIMVSSYCTDNPIEPFINGASVPLKHLHPVNWQNKKYK